MKRLLLFSSCLFLGAFLLPAESASPSGASAFFTEEGSEPAAKGTKQLQVQVEYVEVSHEMLGELLLDAAPAKAAELREKLRELTKSGAAKVLETQLLTGLNGEKRTLASNQEFIYPTEYEPWEVPNEVDVPDKPGGMSPDDVNALDRLVTPATPTSFESRNLGSQLEMESAVSEDGTRIALTLNSSLTWHTGSTVWVERKDSLGNVTRVEMPLITSLRVATQLTCKSGVPVLAGVLSPKDDTGKIDFSRKLMVFVKTDLLDPR